MSVVLNVKEVGILLGAQTVGSLVSNALWGLVGDRYGKLALLKAVGGLRLLPPLGAFALFAVVTNLAPPAALVAFVRLIGAGIFLGIFTLMFSKPYDLTTWPLKEAFLVGVIGTGFGTAFMNFGFRYSNPFNIAVISTMIPLISMIMGTIQKQRD